jgi:hypothetical protein
MHPSGIPNDAVAGEVENAFSDGTCNTGRGLTGAICIIQRLSEKKSMCKGVVLVGYLDTRPYPVACSVCMQLLPV